MGPYYITDLVQLLGPVASVMGSTARPKSERLVTSEPMNGTLIPVEVSTHVAGTLEFESGAVVSIAMSFDVPKHRHAPIEIYGDKGSIAGAGPEPVRRRGAGRASRAANGRPVPLTHGHVEGEFRSIGVADMATAIVDQPAASRQRRARLACARGDGGVPDLRRRRPARQDRKPRRAAGDDAGRT